MWITQHEGFPKVPNKSPKDTEMSDAVYAKSIIDELWPIKTYGRGPVITATYRAIKDVERSLSREVRTMRRREWTERRVRSIVDDEEPRLERYEVADLERMAVKEGRDAYRKSIERASRIAAFLTHVDEDFHGSEIDAQMALVRELSGARTSMVPGGTGSAGASADRAGEWTGRVRRTGTSGADE